jgi:hypothetical protein
MGVAIVGVSAWAAAVPMAHIPPAQSAVCRARLAMVFMTDEAFRSQGID